MILTENLAIQGRAFVRTWSDSGKTISRDGAEYQEAIDPVEFGRTYTETENDIPVSAEEALAELMEVLE